ncbi:MAG: PAS domain S-box protein [Chloroflexi bacterium]|nr:PAS domain S-box protein [Chloroflexota bacterium]
MQLEWTAAAALLLIATALVATTGFIAYRWGRRRGIKTLGAMLLADGVWVFGYAMVLLSVGPTAERFWSAVQATGVISLAYLWPVLALEFTRQDHILARLRNRVLLALPPLVSLLIVWTDPLHGLYFGAWTVFDGEALGPLRFGPWLWVWSLYSAAVMIAGVVVLLRAYSRLDATYRKQARALFALVLLPFAAAVVGLLRGGSLQIAPFGGAVAGLAIVWAVGANRVLDIRPIAYQAFFRNAQHGVLILDDEDHILEINQKAARYLGRTAAEVIGQPLADALAHWPALLDHYRARTDGMIEVPGAGDAQRWYAADVSALRTRGGLFTGRLLLLRDITERRRAEIALRESEARHRALVSASPDAILATGLDGRLLSANAQAARLHGFASVEEMLARVENELTLMTAESRRQALAARETLLSAGEWKNQECVLLRQDGASIPGEWSTSLVRNAAGEPHYLVHVARDISERKQAEAALRRRMAQDALIARISARVVSASSAELAAALDDALRDVGQFTEVDRVFLALLGADGVSLVRHHHWHTPAGDAWLAGRFVASLEQYLWSLRQLRQLQPIVLPAIAEASEEAAPERAFWQATGVHSALAIPLMVDGTLAGYMGLSSLAPREQWSDEDIRLLRVIGEILMNALARADAEQTLREQIKQNEQLLTSLKTAHDQLEQRVAERTREVVAANRELRQEIERRASVEASLRLSEGRNRAILTAVPDVMWLLDPGGRLLACWPSAASQDAWLASPALVGQPLQALLPPQVAALVRQHLEAVCETSAVQTFEFRLPAQHGARSPGPGRQDGGAAGWSAGQTMQQYEGRLASIGDEQMLCLLRNVTEQKAAQRELRQAERLAAFARLSSWLAHEINNPLQSIESNLDLVLDFPIEEQEKRDNLEIVRKEIERLGRLIGTVLNLVSPPSGRQDAKGDAAKAVERVLWLTGRRLKEAQIEATTGLSAAPSVQMSPDHLIQVCLNITLNTIDALAEHGRGRFHIALQGHDDHAILTFTNDGPPIPDEVAPHIFEPFYTTKPSGTGLGLWVCQNLVRQSGGSLTARNLPDDSGVAFTVTLPVYHE